MANKLHPTTRIILLSAFLLSGLADQHDDSSLQACGGLVRPKGCRVHYVHIPKTAGVTVIKMLDEAFPGSFSQHDRSPYFGTTATFTTKEEG